MKTLFLILLSVLSFTVFGQVSVSDLEKSVYEKVKTYKKKLPNYKELSLDTAMSNSCRKHSRYMFDNDDLVHIKNFDGVKGKSEIIQYKVYNGSDVNDLAQKILTNFLNSPPHKQNIHDTSSLIGVGIYIKTIKTEFETETFVSQEIWVTIRFY
jgi:uncharacterized protein YkwD